MSQWNYELIPAAQNDLRLLDGSQQKVVYKALDKLALNPLPRQKGGYGDMLGNKAGVDLSGFLKIKLRGAGLRIVYDLVEKDGKAYVIVIGARQDFEVYRQAEKRLADYREWLSKNGERE